MSIENSLLHCRLEAEYLKLLRCVYNSSHLDEDNCYSDYLKHNLVGISLCIFVGTNNKKEGIYRMFELNYFSDIQLDIDIYIIY
jgi:hypothetical protein